MPRPRWTLAGRSGADVHAMQCGPLTWADRILGRRTGSPVPTAPWSTRSPANASTTPASTPPTAPNSTSGTATPESTRPGPCPDPPLAAAHLRPRPPLTAPRSSGGPATAAATSSGQSHSFRALSGCGSSRTSADGVSAGSGLRRDAPVGRSPPCGGVRRAVRRGRSRPVRTVVPAPRGTQQPSRRGRPGRGRG